MGQRISDATSPVERTVNVDSMLVVRLAILSLVISRLQMERLVQALGSKLRVYKYVVLQGGNVSTLALPYATHHHLART